MMAFRYLFSFIILLGCFLFPTKSQAFDYNTFEKELKQTRSLTPTTTTITKEHKTTAKKSKSSAFRVITQKLLEALDSDVVPAKLFSTKSKFSIYFKPARVTKLGIKLKF